MSTVMIQIRNVPEEIHRTLKARAALAGKSLSDLILEELAAMAAAPSEAEIKARLNEAEPFAMKKSSAAIIRRERDKA
jgi:plasmid stability protein